MRSLTRPTVLAALVTTVLALGSGVAIAATTSSSPHAPVGAVSSTVSTSGSGAESTAPETSTETPESGTEAPESGTSDGPGGHADPAGSNVDHQFNGNE